MRAGVVGASGVGAVLALAVAGGGAAGPAAVEVRLFQFTPSRLQVARGAIHVQ